MAGQTSILAGLGATGNTQGEALTRYWPVFGSPRASSTEGICELPIRADGTAKHFSTYVSANGLNIANSAVFTVRKSGADTAMTVSYSALQTGRKQDTVNTVAFVDGDELAVKCVTADPSGSGTTVTVNDISVEFVPSAALTCLSPIGCFSVGTTFSTASATRYVSLFGAYAPQTSEAQCECKASAAATLHDLWVYVTSNARTTVTTFRVRKNLANGSQSVTFAAGQTGLKEDSGNSDSIAAGDTFCGSFTTSTGTETITIGHMGVWMESATFVGQLAGGSSAGAAFASGATRYIPVPGNATNGVSTESSVEHIAKTPLVVRDLQVYVSANTLNSDCVVCLRDNGADSSMAITYATGQTGWKIDTDVASLDDGDEFCVKVDTTPSGSGSITIHCVAVTSVATLFIDPGVATNSVSAAVLTFDPGVLFPYLTPHGAIDITPQSLAVVHGGIAALPGAGAVTLSGPACSVSHGEARRAIGTAEALVVAPEVSLAFGGATFSPSVAGIALSPPQVNVAISVVLAIDAVSVGIQPPSASPAMGEATLAISPASVVVSGPATGVAASLSIDVVPIRVTTETVRLDVDRTYVAQIGSLAIATTAPGTTVAKETTVQVGAASLAIAPVAPTIPSWSKTLSIAPVELLVRVATPSRQISTMASTTGVLVYCLVASETIAECLVSRVVDAECLVAPLDTASTAAKNNESWENPAPEETA